MCARERELYTHTHSHYYKHYVVMGILENEMEPIHTEYPSVSHADSHQNTLNWFAK